MRRKREIFAFYREALGDLPGFAFMPEAPHGRCTRWLTVLTIDPAAFGAVSEDLFARGLCLPSGRAMTEGDQERVVEGVKGATGTLKGATGTLRPSVSGRPPGFAGEAAEV